ncbi:hypothetical protein BC936DRAFT_142973 [Jimgerdemannia flammicorona]|uniref:RING-type domain-containing protein n=1 Tax=Jimgerdemannia flammicorona TaxID=994334 RepID=A0A432ZZI5_9FUNG|nr:hypothetical protein BC936DRAFT_142973 [Jimgerdemannia flammicorona]
MRFQPFVLIGRITSTKAFLLSFLLFASTLPRAATLPLSASLEISLQGGQNGTDAVGVFKGNLVLLNIGNGGGLPLQGEIRNWSSSSASYLPPLPSAWLALINCDDPSVAAGLTIAQAFHANAAILFSTLSDQCILPNPSTIGAATALPIFSSSSTLMSRSLARTAEQDSKSAVAVGRISAVETIAAMDPDSATASLVNGPQPTASVTAPFPTYSYPVPPTSPLAPHNPALDILYAIAGLVMGIFAIGLLMGFLRARVARRRAAAREAEQAVAAAAANTARAANARVWRGGLSRQMLESFPVKRFAMNKEQGKWEDEKEKAGAADCVIPMTEANADVADHVTAPLPTETVECSPSLSTENHALSRVISPSLPTLGHMLVEKELPQRPDGTVENEPAHTFQLMCAICLDDYDEGEEVRVLPCGHEYHAHSQHSTSELPSNGIPTLFLTIAIASTPGSWRSPPSALCAKLTSVTPFPHVMKPVPARPSQPQPQIRARRPRPRRAGPRPTLAIATVAMVHARSRI